MVCHCVQCGARAATVSFPWGDVLRPYAAFAWPALGRDAADLALESDQVDEEEGEVPAHPAGHKDAAEEFRVDTAADAAECDNDEHHGGWLVGEWISESSRYRERKGEERIVSFSMGVNL